MVKRKILILNNSDKISGAEVSLLYLLNELKKSYSITIVVPIRDGMFYEKVRDDYDIRVLKLKRIQRSVNSFFLFKDFVHLLLVSFKLSKIAIHEQFDYVYANNNQAYLYCVFIKLMTFKKIIWHVRDNISNKFFASFLALFSSKIICVSNFIWQQIPCKESKKIIIYNNININDWEPVKVKTGTIRKKYQFEDNLILVGHIGQLVPWKKTTEFIYAAKSVLNSFDNIHFFIVGEDLFEDNYAYSKSLKNIVKEMGLESKITFSGYKSNIKEYINDFDIIVHCAHNEPFGRIIIECMAMSKAIIAFNSGGIKEILTDNRNALLCSPGNVEELSKKINFLAKEKKVRTRLGKLARHDVIKQFSINPGEDLLTRFIDSQ